jgi:hypothetical protein
MEIWIIPDIPGFSKILSLDLAKIQKNMINIGGYWKIRRPPKWWRIRESPNTCHFSSEKIHFLEIFSG